MNPTAIVFDLDQTLFDRQRAMNDWIASQRRGNEPLTRCDQARLRLLDQNGYGDRETFFAEARLMTDKTIDHPSFIRSFVQFLQPDRSLIRCLKHLRSNYSIAILTNGGVWTQRMKIHSLSLGEVFPRDRTFVSAAIGFEKPDPRAFAVVARALGVPGKDCLYFGDSMENDIVGARAAGWRTHRVRGPSELIQHLVELTEDVPC